MTTNNWPAGLPFTGAEYALHAPVAAADWYSRIVKPVSDAIMALRGPRTAAWQSLTLLNGWVPYNASGAGSDYPRVEFQRFGNIVLFRGLVKNGAGIIANLPADCRPSATLRLPASSNNAMATLTIDAAGNLQVIAYETGASNVYVALEGITYMAD
jgi:hypothetical protein